MRDCNNNTLVSGITLDYNTFMVELLSLHRLAKFAPPCSCTSFSKS